MRARSAAVAVVLLMLVAASSAQATPEDEAAAFAKATKRAAASARAVEPQIKRIVARYFRSIRPCEDKIRDLAQSASEPTEKELFLLGFAYAGLLERVVPITWPLERRFAVSLVAIRALDPVLRRAARAWRRLTVGTIENDEEPIDVCAALETLENMPLPDIPDGGETVNIVDDYDRITAGSKRLKELGVPDRVADKFVDPITSSLPSMVKAIERLLGPALAGAGPISR